MSPPCGTWSRAPWANVFGPRPLRSWGHPWGFLWLEGARLRKVNGSNSMIRLCLEVITLLQSQGFVIPFLLEHPEDLGKVYKYRQKAHSAWFGKVDKAIRPASIWQLPQLRAFASSNVVFTRAFHQCAFGAESPKPTRVLTSLVSWKEIGFGQWPQFDDEGLYKGPLPKQCSCGRDHPPLISKDLQGNFNTSAAAAYPPQMDQFIAESIWHHAATLHQLRLKRPVGKMAEQVDGNEMEEQGDNKDTKEPSNSGAKALDETVEAEKGKSMPTSSTKVNPSVAPGSVEDASWDGTGGDPQWKGKRKAFQAFSKGVKAAPLQVWYKGKVRRMVDGLGKCSPGIRPAGGRGVVLTRQGSELASAFWAEVESYVDRMNKDERLRLIAKLALGKFQGSPFGDEIKSIRKRLDGVVCSLGKDPARIGGDRETEINFRRLKAWSDLTDDEDHSYLPSLASKGVPLGTRSEVGRVKAVYDPKSKGEEDVMPSAWQDEMEPNQRSNYSSAVSHLELVRGHVMEDVEKGWIVTMSMQEARSKFGDELQIAALGAVPKDQKWSDVRVVHDGTHGIQLNTRISQPNKMEFPQFDDLQAALGAFREGAPVKRMLFAFDIRSAHRLIPVQPSDWGLQAFQLEDGDQVFCNTVGTFGVTTASFWWGRLASTLFRVFHRVLPAEALLYLLLFADDGLAMVGGDDYHKLVIALFLYLEIMEVPLSWKKTRGGLKAEWIGYTVDLEKWLIGISQKKVDWLRQWVKATNAEGRIMGRDFRAGIGRMGFLAGAIKGARPFLAPLYALAARVGNTSFVELHMAVRISLEFFADWVVQEPMKPPADPPGVAGEVFRVDAMGSDQGICIGGWETYGGSDPAVSRWFSVELTRKDAPWLYIRGEPHRTIAASELLAVTVAVIVFGPEAKWRNKHGRLVLSGFTDNASNTYLVDKYLSVKFPVSMVLMELSRQLAKLGSELQLHWIPREQNEESDDLSKGRFDRFDERLRVQVDFDKLELLVIPKLVEHAMEFDKEIQIRKTSKGDQAGAKLMGGRTPAEEKLRLRQPW